MKLGNIAKLGLAALAATVSISPALAAGPSGCPSDHVTVIRTSKLKPGATMAGFEKAMAIHAKWYADHGFTRDGFKMAPVLVPNTAKNDLVKSPDMVMTMHTNSSYIPRAKRDAGWTNFVNAYRAVSVIQTETSVCMPE